MSNMKPLKKDKLKSKLVKVDLNQQEYKKHFQLAVINLEQNLFEERMPELMKTA